MLSRLEDGSVSRVALDAAPTGIVVADGAGTILYANEWTGHIFGCRPSDITGRSIGSLIPALGQTIRLDGQGDSVGPATPGPTATSRTLTAKRHDGTDIHVDASWRIAQHDIRQLLLVSIAGINERLQLADRQHEVSGDHASFERLVTSLATRFVRVQPEALDDAIVESLEQVVERFDLDRSTWWHVAKGGKDAVATYTWTRPEFRLIQSRESAEGIVPWVMARVRDGEPFSFNDPDDVPSAEDRETFRRFGTKSGAAMPFCINGEFRAMLGFSAIRRRFEWSPEVMERLRLVGAVFGQALIRKETDEELRNALAEVRRLHDQTGSNVHFRHDIKPPSALRLLVAESPATKRVLEQLESVAATPATVLLLGETGTGKEVCAQVIHRASERHGRSMITVNCGAIPATLIESELFGREKGAFTGALARQIGRFEMAHESTIFLDEIAELPLDAQVKLLRVIQERVIERLGGGQPVKVNVRIIAATNRNLEKAVADRTFREDLFYRLNVFPITIPPLRERVEDIPALVWSFIEEYSAAFRKPIDSISRESVAALKRYSWPGNVRELRNVIERAVIISKGPHLVVELPASAGVPAVPKSTRLHDLEVDQIRAVLESVGWRVRGPGGAAELLGLKPNTLDSRMAKLGIRRQPRRPN
jgi:PAS domain S-box-containing protein